MKHTEHPEPYETLFRIQRGLAGHISYLAACDTNVTFTEYLLYEPILRVLMTRKYDVQCEVSCADFLEEADGGDHKRIDFVAAKNEVRFALEVKWPRKGKRTLDVQVDHEKLAAFRKKYPNSESFLCVFGRFNHIDKINLSPDYFIKPKLLPPIYAYFTRTQYGCKIYQLEVA
jgi:hypothetical protein